MPTTLRDLLPRVMLYRPDLDDAKGMFCIMEAMRQLTQNAAILRDELGIPVNLDDRATSILPYLDTDRTLFRAEYLRYLKMPDGARFAGYWNAKDNIPDLEFIAPEPVPFDRWVRKADMAVGRRYPAVGYMSKNEFLLFGGADGVVPPVDSTNTVLQFYNSKEDKYSEPIVVENVSPPRFSTYTNSAPQARRFAQLTNGNFLMCGGISMTGDNRWKRTFILDYATKTVTPGPLSPYGIGLNSNQIVMPDGVLYFSSADFIIASSRTALLRYVWQDSIIDNTIVSPIPASAGFATMPNDDIRMVKGTEKKILVSVGWDGGSFQFIPTGFIGYNIDTGLWDTQAITNAHGAINRSGLQLTGVAMTYAGHGRVIIAGGTTTASRAVQVLDVDAKAFTTVATLPAITDVGDIIDITGGRFLIVGKQGTSAVAYILDLSNGSLKSTPGFFPLNLDFSYTISSSSDGRNVYFFGGGTVEPPFNWADGKQTLVFQPKVSEFTKNGYWIVDTAGKTDLGGEELDHWELNDVVYNDGDKWNRYDDTKFSALGEANEVVTNEVTASRGPNGTPSAWAQVNGDLYTYPRTLNQDVLKVNYSYSFSGNEHSVVNVPNEVEQIVVDGALSKLLMLPGEGANLNLATMHESKFKRGIANMRAVGMFGYGGTPRYVASPFSATSGFSVTW